MNARFFARPVFARPAFARPALARPAPGRGLLPRLWAWLAHELAYRRDIEHLQRLNDEQLGDLGLSRGGIEGAVRGRSDPHA